MPGSGWPGRSVDFGIVGKHDLHLEYVSSRKLGVPGYLSGESDDHDPGNRRATGPSRSIGIA